MSENSLILIVWTITPCLQLQGLGSGNPEIDGLIFLTWRLILGVLPVQMAVQVRMFQLNNSGFFLFEFAHWK